ncbi:MAG TPA: 3-methyl-2-oxobutanoate hydroxymethyltransferase [Candidatus Methylomirabilis sp.]|jgi:3-methyl-2-oxobutanoate hydroxymethyltransferase|nr:3-methyl-2-oxobutanoate hydroxymethyltransferase [Candidatus Methylomirabilis sp.]
MRQERVTATAVRAMKGRGERVVMLTAYDTPTARLLDAAGVEIILVGDSLAMVALGYETTLPVTLEEMLHHTRAVARGASRALVVGDLPFLSYQVSREEALRSAGRMVKEGNAQAVKLEGGVEVAATVAALVEAGMPVMGHIGLTPQAIHRMGGYKVQGRSAEAAARLLKDAVALEQAGAFSLVLEGLPWQVAAAITGAVGIPTIGIGAGPRCDGQVLVTNDLLGLFDEFTPKFVKRYANLRETLLQAFGQFREEVRTGTFPGPEHSFSLEAGEAEKLQRHLARTRPRKVAAFRK